MGRVTYDEWAQYWPTSQDEPFASWINSVPKFVASTTLTSADWSNSTIIDGPVVDFVKDLRQQPGGTIGVSGSLTLVRTLIEHGVLDELTLMISPVVAGGGLRKLFADDATRTNLQLVDAKPTSTGAVIVTYRPVS